MTRRTPLGARKRAKAGDGAQDPSRGATGVSRKKPRKRLRARSAKRATEREARLVVVEETKRRARWRCEAEKVVPEVMCGGVLDVHERTPRGVRPGSELDQDECVLLCRLHHDWAHAFPAEAARRGLRRWSWERRATVAPT